MRKILIIEDETDIRDNIAEILQLSNYQVVKVSDGLSGVQAAILEHPDLIICDIAMPGLDGYGVLHALQQYPVTQNLPFIFLTASDGKQQVRKAMTAGADDFLSKPFEGIELLNAVESCLKKRSVIRSAAQKKSPNGEPLAVSIAEYLRLLPDQRDLHPFHKKQVVYLEGQRPPAIYYLISGKIKNYQLHSDGKEYITKIAGPGDFVGYSALLQDTNYQDNAQALEETTVMLIDRKEFLDLIAADGHITQYFIDLLAIDLKNREQSLLNLAYSSLRKRVANGLLQLVAKFPQKEGNDFSIGISRDNLSHLIGSATESLTRTLSDFRNENLIDIRDGKIYILNPQRLENLGN
jgi:CRP-like cAMP-binding protein/CheY-like chemotaxis protein